MTSFLGIYREPECSPGRHAENDAAILELVAAALEARGHSIALANGDDAPRFADSASVIFSMSRSPRLLDLLARWAKEGRRVINRPDAVLATARSTLVGRALGSVALPAAHVMPTARTLRPQAAAAMAGAWWVKGGDLYASRREDVQRVETTTELERTLDDFALRGISTAVLQQHVQGREIKFYAAGSGFFYWLDTNEPAVNGTTSAMFQSAALQSGHALELEIFGGDVVIDADGRVTLIDLNDWPSFAPCRDAAAAAIAAYVERCARGSCGALPAALVGRTS
jgi:hypothetical protein